MENRTVIITGGNSGIGKATAIGFAKKGYNVVISGRNESTGIRTLSEIRAKGVEAEFFKADVRHEEDVIKLINGTMERFGKIDIMVNNGGIAGASEGLLADTSAVNMRDLLDTNVMGVFFGMKYSINAMLNNGGGAIINLASIAGLNGILYAAQYCASKHAVVGLTKAAAVEYAQHGIRINAVAPGAIKTEVFKSSLDSGLYTEESIAAIHPMNRMGVVEDIANAIIFLAAEENSFLTGSILSVDGGFNAK
ncbi:SDR family NAD(P)-dependent oxidoreductase [Pedobacter sp.]|uniref:SDR family NAD(P)-dependent oxidoreductase n=1 Tax=Pedobacter sp. TaxID=1411316 RepID=UPI003D7F3FB4